MYKLCIVFLTVLLYCLTILPNATVASGDNCGGISSLVEGLEYSVDGLQSFEEILRSTSPDEWTTSDITNYQMYALATVYLIYYMEVIENSWSHPGDPNDVMCSEYATTWPLNPFNGWEPIEILAATDDFSAGDIIRQICPPSESTSSGKQVSFELSMFGPSLDWTAKAVKPVKGNETWVTFPKGTALTMGVHVENAAEHEVRLEMMRAIVNAEDKESDE